ncbi:NAD(P)/FAD-dependent oxidoreductase [Gemmobacter serpentinus]|uniref:NAD(P)/FAD-dependent oxidoreductase n=1 Tax=Gemmobacter serpentinus TaxID=2652247 RepID=UPI00124ED69B|nr:FAD-binding oxidoreductase [Gemmobacter serpentinus]
MAYPDTYYRRSIADTHARAALSGRADCDTVIVGAGLAGLTTALELVRGGQSVIVLEQESVGFGASGRNGGFVSPGFAAGDDQIARIAGAATARDLFKLSIEGVDYIRKAITEIGMAGVAPEPGILSVRRHDGDGASLRAHAAAMQRDFGYRLDYLETPQLRELLHSRRYFQALRDPNAFHMHPLNYLRGLAAEIERLGGRIHEMTPATGAVLEGAEKIIRTPGGEVRAARAVITTGGYTGALVPKMQRAFLPIATYVMLSEPAPDLIATAIATRHAVGDNRRAGDYYRLVDGGQRILWGGRITTRAASTEGLVRELRHEMLTVYPQLKGLKTELAWSGLMSYARHLMPQIGEMAPGVWHCTAFGGHGLNTTAIGGKVVAEAILGQSDRARLFKPFGLVWAGGPAGLVAAQLTYWKLQAQDWWRERGSAEVAS